MYFVCEKAFVSLWYKEMKSTMEQTENVPFVNERNVKDRTEKVKKMSEHKNEKKKMEGSRKSSVILVWVK